jgi:hypothetical protein
VYRAGTQPLDALQMFLCGVAFVRGEPVTGVQFIQFNHEAIASDLGDDGGAGYRKGYLISLHDASLRQVDLRQADEVDEQRIGRRSEVIDGLAHCHLCRSGDAVLVYRFRRDLANAYSDGGLAYQRAEVLARLGCKLLAVAHEVQPGGIEIERKDHCPCHHRPRQRAAPHLVDAGDEVIALLRQLLLLGEGGRIFCVARFHFHY